MTTSPHYDAPRVATCLANVAQQYGAPGATALALALGRVAARLGIPLAGVLETVRAAHGASYG